MRMFAKLGTKALGALVTGAVAAGVVVVYVVVVPADKSEAPGTQLEQSSIPGANTSVPDEIIVSVLGDKSFICDFTADVEEICVSTNDMFAVRRIFVRRHPGDHRKVSITAFGKEQGGVTWPELMKGVKVGDVQVVAQPKPANWPKR